jgi:hypothetical protein
MSLLRSKTGDKLSKSRIADDVKCSSRNAAPSFVVAAVELWIAEYAVKSTRVASERSLERATI